MGVDPRDRLHIRLGRVAHDDAAGPRDGFLVHDFAPFAPTPPKLDVVSLLREIANAALRQLDRLRVGCEERKKTALYEMDGLVIYQNKYVEYPNGKLPEHVIAFKLDEAEVETVVTGVVWEASKHGLLKPVVYYESVNWKNGSADLQRANGHNARYIDENKIGPGARIMITRRGDVIPYIVRVIQGSYASLPDPNVTGAYAWNDNHVELVLLQDNDQVRAAKIESFFEKLDIDQLGPSRSAALVNAGLDDVHSVIQANQQELVDVLGPTLGVNAYQNIHSKIKNVPLATLMAASGIFPNIGETLFNLLLEAYPQMHLWFYEDPNAIANAFLQVKGFKKRATEIANKMREFGDWLKDNPEITFSVPSQRAQSLLTADESVAQIPQTLAGKEFSITGFTVTKYPDIIEAITSHGGTIHASGVRKSTNYLLTSDGKPSNKTRDAQKYNIPIIPVSEVRSTFGI